VTLTRAHHDELVSRFGPRRNVAVVPDGARINPAQPLTPPPQTGAPVIGYAGHLYPWKGVDVLIEALARVPGVNGLIAGGQPGERDRSRLEALARARGIGDRVEFAGWCAPREVAALLLRCQLLVLPNVRTTISERYTSPLKLFEYLAAGRPIIASDLPALREVLTDAVNALLVPPGDPVAMAGAMARLLADPVLGDRLARQARTDAASYSWDARATRLEPVLSAAGDPS
jgi:glycosyltransferase involved in cell wall biosynthesis